MIRKGSLSRKIEHMSPDEDYADIVRLLSYTLFPWDIEKSLEFALFRTYAIPSISKLLAATGEFTQQPRKRYDDTELLLSEIAENGFESSRAQQALTRINAMHGHYKIRNNDYLYVLSTFIFEPLRWMKKYGVRALTEHETRAWFNYYIELGRRMNIQEMPSDIEEFERFNRDYEARHFVYSDSNRVIGETSRDMFLGFYLPKPLWFLGKPAIYSMMETSLRAAFGFSKPSKLTVIAVQFGLGLRKKCLQLLPERRKPSYLTQRRRPTYPNGYAIESLGTFRACPHKPHVQKTSKVEDIAH